MARAPNEKAKLDYIKGMKYKDIAEKYSVSINTVKSWKTRYNWNKKGVHTKSKKVFTQNIEKDAEEKEVSWIDIENEYVTRIIPKPCTIKGLSIKYNVDYNYLRQYASKNKWNDKREKYVTNVSQKTIEKSAEKHVYRNLKILAISDMIADVIEEYVEDKQYKKYVVKYKHYIDGKADSEELVSQKLDVVDTKAFSNMVSSLEKIQKGQRLAEGLDKPNEEDSEQQKGNLDKLIDVFNKGPVIE